MDPAALHSGAGHGGLDSLAQAQVGVGDHQLHPGQAPGLQAAEELGPEGAILGVPDPKAKDLTAAVTHTPVATTTAWATTRRLTRALQ